MLQASKWPSGSNFLKFCPLIGNLGKELSSRYRRSVFEISNLRFLIIRPKSSCPPLFRTQHFRGALRNIVQREVIVEVELRDLHQNTLHFSYFVRLSYFLHLLLNFDSP